MSFIWPVALLGLLLVPAAVAAYMYADRRRRRDAARFGNTALLAGLVEAPPRWKRHVPIAIALAALTFLLVGMARPEATLSVDKEEATIILALDTSRSMAADDVQPSRLDAARTAAAAFLEDVPETYRVGVVAFSTRAQIVLPPTQDREAAKTALLALRLGSGTVDRRRDRALGDPRQTPRRPDRQRTLYPPPCCSSRTAPTPPARRSRSRLRSAPDASVCPYRRLLSARVRRPSRCRCRGASASASRCGPMRRP